MSIELYVERRKRRFLFCLALSVAGLLLTGAKEITRELRGRPAHLQTVQVHMQSWAETPAWEALAEPRAAARQRIPDAEVRRRHGWARLSRESPEALIKACSRGGDIR